MKITYQPQTDSSFYLYLKEDAKSARSEEVAPETVLDFDEEGNVVGIEIYGHAASRVDLGELRAERYADDTGEGAIFSVGTEFLTQQREAAN